MAKLNSQGLSRKSIGLMSCILPDPGYVFVSSDASAGEPSIITQFSGDRNYHDATFGTGKPPYYDVNGVLKIDDIYLTGASISPMGSRIIKEAFYNTYDGLTFSQKWLLDPEFLKNELKATRQFHKILILGLGYSMGPRKMISSAYENGYILSFEDAQAFYRAYWNLFKDVRKLSNYLTQKVEQDGFIINPFGYRLTPEPRKAFNYFIQSSLSGIFHLYCREVFDRAPWAKFVTVIHDELVVQVPKEKVEAFRKVINEVTDVLNTNLGWSVKLRFGFAVGTNLYEAK